MGIFVLTETSAGFALFKAKDKGIFKQGDLSTDFDAAGINGLYVRSNLNDQAFIQTMLIAFAPAV